MSVKPLPGGIPSLFTANTVFSKAGDVAEAKAATNLFKPVGKKAGPLDEVSFSSQALAALKSGAGTATAHPASTPAAATPPGASQTAVSRPKATATTAGYGAQASPDTPPLRLNVEGERPTFDPNRDAEKVSHVRSMTIHAFARNDMLRTTFGLPKDIEKGGGLMLTGNIETVIDRTMQMDAATVPETPESVLERRKAVVPGDPSMPEGTAKTSMITLFLPGSQGSGSEQVDILFDDAALSKLAAMPPDAVKAGLVDMMADTGAARSGNAAMTGGTLGKFIAENGDYHPELASPRARYGVFDPERGESGQPMLMIQSKSRPDYVREHAGDLVDAVMGLLRSLGPSGATATA